MLVSKNAQICGTLNMKHNICVTKMTRWPCTFHVVCAHLVTQRELSLQWNMGFTFFFFFLDQFRRITTVLPFVNFIERKKLMHRVLVVGPTTPLSEIQYLPLLTLTSDVSEFTPLISSY